MTSNQPAGTVAANTPVDYSIDATLEAGRPSLAAGGTVPLTLTLPAGFTVSSLLGPGWTITAQNAGSDTVVATYTATAPFSAGRSLPQLVVVGTFASATYAPVLTASDNFTVPNYLDTDSNLVFTNAATATFTVGSAGSFQLTPAEAAALSEASTDSLPAGLSFNPTTGLLTGTPAVGSGGTYTLDATATALVGQSYTQAFTLTVDEPLSVQTLGSTTFTVGQGGSYGLLAYGYPAVPTTAVESITGNLPAGVYVLTSAVGQDGLAVTVGGVPNAGTGGTYAVQQTVPAGVFSSTPVGSITPLTLTGDGRHGRPRRGHVGGQGVRRRQGDADRHRRRPQRDGGRPGRRRDRRDRRQPRRRHRRDDHRHVLRRPRQPPDGRPHGRRHVRSGRDVSPATPTTSRPPAVASRSPSRPRAVTLTDVTAQLKVARGGLIFSARTKTYTQTLTITDTDTDTDADTGAAVTGPLSLLLPNLSGTATLSNRTGVTTVAHGSTAAGTSYVTLPATTLAAGGSESVGLQFTTTTTPSYGLQVLLGTGTL